MKFNIEKSNKYLENTDPQRRCYNGCHAKSEIRQTPWTLFEFNISSDKIERRLKFWEELSDYAVSFRGEGARTMYRKVIINEK